MGTMSDKDWGKGLRGRTVKRIMASIDEVERWNLSEFHGAVFFLFPVFFCFANFAPQTKRGLIKSSIKPPRGLISKTFGVRGLIEKEAYLRGGGGRGLAHLFCEMVVSVIHKELEWTWKSSSTRSWRSCSQGSKSELKHTGSVHMKFYSRDWLIQSIINL